MNWELPDVQAGSLRGRGIRNQIANICRIIEKAREFQKDIFFCFTDYTKSIDFMDHNNFWESLKQMWIPDHLTCLLKNVNAGHEAIVRTRHGTTDWFKIGKGVWQSCILSPWLFNMHADSITWNIRLDGSQAGIKIAVRTSNSLRYAPV